MPAPAFERAFRQALCAQGLLLLASLRHHCFWGERFGAWVPPALNALELVLVLAATWLGWRAAGRAAEAAADGTVPEPVLRRRSSVLLLAACAVLPFLSMDAVNAITRGRILAVHGQNPYVVTAAQIGGDPILQLGDAGWASFPLPYGPVIACLQGAVAWLSDLAPLAPAPKLWLGVLLWKLLNAGALLGIAVAARGIATFLGAAPRRVFVLVLWNPLLLLELAANAHNDAFLALGVGGAVLAALRAAPLWSGLLACAAVLTKFVPVIVLPFLLVVQVRAGRGAAWRWLAGFPIAGLLLLVPILWLTEPHALDFLTRQTELGWQREPWLSLAAAGVEPRRATVLLRAVLVAFVLAGTLVVWRHPRPGVLVTTTAATLLLASALISPLFCPWYHAWWLPLALCLPPGGFLPLAASLVTLCAPASYAVWLGWRSFDGPHGWVQVGVGLVLPLLLAALVVRRR